MYKQVLKNLFPCIKEGTDYIDLVDFYAF